MGLFIRKADDSDAALLARTRLGDLAARETLVRRHLPAAYSVALGVLRDVSDAEDASQDAMIFALERLEQCREPSRFAAWLCRIARNRALDVLDRRRVRTTESLDGVSAAAEGPAPDHEVEQGELRERLMAALGALKPVQREVVLLHDMEGLTHVEIASALGISAGMSRQHLFQARRMLRSILGHTFMRDWYAEPAG